MVAAAKSPLAIEHGCSDPSCDACRAARELGREPSSATCIGVQAPAPDHPDTGDIVLVPMSIADALGVGHSVRTLVRGRKLPPGTAEIYERVAKSMISEARLAIAKQQGGAR